MRRLGLLFALVTLGLTGAASASWHRGTRAEAKRQAQRNYSVRLSRCRGSRSCRNHAQRDYRRDLANINRGFF